MTIGRAFTELASRAPMAPAVQDATGEVSRAVLEDRANTLARRFIAEGVSPDSFVTVVGENTIDTVVAYVAAWKAGATPQPLSPRLPSAERDAVVRIVDPAVVVSAEPLPGRAWLPLSVGRAADGAGPMVQDLAASSWKAPTSSGSTGVPKVIMAAASAHVDPDGVVAAFVPREATQLVAGPLFHAAPFVYAMRGLMTGHSLVLLPRFDAGAWLAAVERHRVTWGMLVPTMMSRILALGLDRLAAADVSSLVSILHIGAACPAHVKRAWIDWLGPERVVEVYSGTESNGLTMIRGAEWLAHPGSVGRPVGGSSIRVVLPDGGVAGPGVPGRIEMTRPGPATYRYLGAGSPGADAWHSLGDIGMLDADGYLTVLDREDDRIVSGGVNIWPATIEGVLEQHPAVRSCVVVGVEDADLGQRVRAVVDIAAASVTVGELEAWAALRFDPEQRPREWVIVHRLVRDDTGKVRRRRWASAAVSTTADVSSDDKNCGR